MDETRPIDVRDAEAAQRVLIAPLADLLETASDLCASPDPALAAMDIANLCRDAAMLADAMSVIARRTAP